MAVSAEYLAGFFDGEGHISMCGTKRHSFMVCVTNCNLEVMQNIQESFGGILDARAPRKPQHALSYRIRWSAQQGKIVLEQILPFLVVKRREVEFMLQRWYPIVYRGKASDAVKQERAFVTEELKKIAKARRGTYPLAIQGE